MENPSLLSKFKGSMLAALVGDCIGARYEVDWCPVAYKELVQMDQSLKAKDQRCSFLWYTDDTEMAHVLAQSLITDREFSATNVAIRFADTFFKAPSCRFYGGSVGTVFQKIKLPSYANKPFKAAAEQFDGDGSYGNGSGMRVFPVALFCHKNCKDIEELASSSARLTHAHIDAVNGAIIQAMAVEYALSSNFQTTWKDIWHSLKQTAERLEAEKEHDAKPYSSKLDLIHEFLDAETQPSVFRMAEKIGTGIKATEAISAAIFSFLSCLADRQPVELSEFNKVQQTIFYAISLGGDTDTIATMAGAIAGAFYGHELVPDYWLDPCEGKKDAEDFAISLHEIVSKRISS